MNTLTRSGAPRLMFRSALLAAALFASPAPAANLYLAGPDVRVEQAAEGDLVAAAGRIAVEAPVKGDAVLAAGSVEARAPITDDLRAAGGILTLASRVGGETLAAGASVHVLRSARLHGRTWLAGNEVFVEGEVRGELKVYGRHIRIAGEVHGPVTLTGERITIADGARIHGDVRYTGGEEIDIASGARITGAVVREPGVFELPRPTVEIPGLAAARPLLAFGLLVFGLLMYAVFPNYTLKAARTLQRAPLKSLGLGGAMFFSVPPVVLLLVITIIGIPLALVVAAVYGVAMLAAYLVSAFFLGDRLLRLVGRAEASGLLRYVSLTVALFLLWGLRQMPYAGGVVVPAALLFGLGALTLQLFTQYSDRT